LTAHCGLCCGDGFVFFFCRLMPLQGRASIFGFFLFFLKIASHEAALIGDGGERIGDIVRKGNV